MNFGWLVGTAPDAGWFGYANLTSRQFSPGPPLDFWILAIQILGISSILGAFNFVVTIINSAQRVCASSGCRSSCGWCW